MIHRAVRSSSRYCVPAWLVLLEQQYWGIIPEFILSVQSTVAVVDYQQATVGRHRSLYGGLILIVNGVLPSPLSSLRPKLRWTRFSEPDLVHKRDLFPFGNG